MLRREFHYELPDGLIAHEPLAERSASRLLHLDGADGTVTDRAFRDLPGMLQPGDLVVLNDTRVFPARLFARKPTGGRAEILVERLRDDAHRALAHVRASKPVRPGTRLAFDDGTGAEVLRRDGDLFELAFDEPVSALAERLGHVPLPPYIRRPDGPGDRERYQTVYARRTGAVAAPTAGLHFDEDTIARLDAAGVERAFVTLHVGSGTFQPVRAERIEDHALHPEYVEVGTDVCAAVAAARARGRRVVAVGTTVVRSLEAAAAGGSLAPFSGETRLFVKPGFRFRVVDRLLTNFHLPESTLLMLVCAFAGHAHTMVAYRHAVEQRYRFFSYGDAMLVDPDSAVLEPR